MDDKSRIAEVRINPGTAFPGDISDDITYIIENQIGSSVMRTNTSGTEIDKEEYYPFGDSSLRTFTYKRYRYVGKERDAESGLYYYGARYYAAWTCRFISVDPLIAQYPQITPYNYADNNPINDFDIDGMQDNNTERPMEKKQQTEFSSKIPYAETSESKIQTTGTKSTIYIDTKDVKFAEGEQKKYEQALRKELDINNMQSIDIKFIKGSDDLKLNDTDQLVALYFDQYNSNVQGKTESGGDNKYQVSRINLAPFTVIAEYSGAPSILNDRVITQPKSMANTTIHEVFHGFLARATKFYGTNENTLGASDDQGHFNSSPNILNSGNVRANAGAMDLDDKKNNNKILSIEKLPSLLQGIIESWQQKKSTFTFVPLLPFQKK
jgi:RHS repeat-associated protein